MDHPELAKTPLSEPQAHARGSRMGTLFSLFLALSSKPLSSLFLKASGPLRLTQWIRLRIHWRVEGPCFPGAYRCRMNHSAARSSPVGFSRSIRNTFFLRFQRVSCFSRSIAVVTSSPQTGLNSKPALSLSRGQSFDLSGAVYISQLRHPDPQDHRERDDLRSGGTCCCL